MECLRFAYSIVFETFVSSCIRILHFFCLMGSDAELLTVANKSSQPAIGERSSTPDTPVSHDSRKAAPLPSTTTLDTVRTGTRPRLLFPGEPRAIECVLPSQFVQSKLAHVIIMVSVAFRVDQNVCAGACALYEAMARKGTVVPSSEEAYVALACLLISSKLIMDDEITATILAKHLKIHVQHLCHWESRVFFELGCPSLTLDNIKPFAMALEAIKFSEFNTSSQLIERKDPSTQTAQMAARTAQADRPREQRKAVSSPPDLRQHEKTRRKLQRVFSFIRHTAPRVSSPVYIRQVPSLIS